MFRQRFTKIEPPVSCPSFLPGGPFENGGVGLAHTHTHTHSCLCAPACLCSHTAYRNRQSESSDGPELKLGWYGWDVTVRHVYLSLANLWWCTCPLNPLHHSTTSPSLPCNLFANYLINIVYCGKTGVVVVFLSIYNLRISPHVLILPS